MVRIARKCTQCGSFDTRERWSSLDEATKAGAFRKAWACSTCAWTEFDLAEDETETGTQTAGETASAGRP
jgi:hypothetical protein